MADVTPSSSRGGGVVEVTWADVSTGDTVNGYTFGPGSAPVAGSIQFEDTFGGGTFTLEGTNDGTNWHTVKDVFGADISLTAAGMREFSLSCRAVRIGASGGSSDNVTATMILRGQG